MATEGFIVSSVCPECGATLAVRAPTKLSKFIGCSRWPSCLFRTDYVEAVQRGYAGVAELEAEVARLRAAKLA